MGSVTLDNLLATHIYFSAWDFECSYINRDYNQYNVGTAHTIFILVITVNLRRELEISIKLMAFAQSDLNNGLNIKII